MSESKVSEEIKDPHAVPSLPKVTVTPISERYAQDGAAAEEGANTVTIEQANAEGIKLVLANSNEAEEDIIKYLMTNPRNGKRMSYEDSRMMYG